MVGSLLCHLEVMDLSIVEYSCSIIMDSISQHLHHGV